MNLFRISIVGLSASFAIPFVGFASQTYGFRCTSVIPYTPYQKWKYELSGFATQVRERAAAVLDSDGLRLNVSTVNWTKVKTEKGEEWDWQERAVSTSSKVNVLFFGQKKAEFSSEVSVHGLFLYLRLPGKPDQWIEHDLEGGNKIFVAGHLAVEHYFDPENFIVSSDLYSAKKIPHCTLTPIYPK